MKLNKLLLSSIGVAGLCFSAGALADVFVPVGKKGGFIHIEKVGAKPSNVGITAVTDSNYQNGVGVYGTLFQPGGSGPTGKTVLKDLDVYVAYRGSVVHPINIHR